MPTLQTNQADLYYELTGTGKRTIILIHGYTCDHTDWHFQVQNLSAKYQIVTCDLRGHGKSTGGKPGCTIETFAGDVNGLFKELNLRDIVLVGHSMGCRVVLEAYMQNPRAVKGIVLVDGSVRARGNARDEQELAMKAMEKQGFKEFVKCNFAGMFFGDHDIDMRDRIIERALNLNPEFGTSVRYSSIGWDAAKMDAALSNVKVPLLVLQSTGINSNSERFSLKKADTTSWLDLVRRLVPSAKVEVIPGCGHFVMLEAPGAVNELINSFAAQLNQT